MENWHYLSVQTRINTIGNWLVSLYGLLVFVISVFSMDFIKDIPAWITNYGFECLKGTTARWWIQRSVSSGTLWELQFLIVFMYTTVAVIVLATVPFKYNRLKLTEKEKKEDAKKKKKKQKKR